MMLEALFFVFLIFAVCAIAYRGAVHEFMILQKEYRPDMNWSELLGEQVPLVIRNVPRTWLGSWTRVNTMHRPWDVYVSGVDGKKLKTTWKDWLQTPDALVPQNAEEIARHAKLSTAIEHMYADGFRRWSWLPSFQTRATAHVLAQRDVMALQKNRAESTLIMATDGAPIELWLAHEGAIPSHIVEDMMGKDPWAITANEIPWIGEVKYVEIKLRPGNAVSIPSHWYYAIRRDPSSPADSAWYWLSRHHTAMSWVASRSTPLYTQIKTGSA